MREAGRIVEGVPLGERGGGVNLEIETVDSPFAMAAEQHPERTIRTPVGLKPSEVEPLPHSLAGVEHSA